MSNYETSADRAKRIRKALKLAHGRTGRTVSVRASNFSQGSAIRIEIKDADIALDVVQGIAKACDVTNGCTQFLTVTYAHGALDALAAVLAEQLANLRETGGKLLGLFSVYIQGNHYHVYDETGAKVADLTECEGADELAGRRMARVVAARGILSGWE